MAAIGTTSRASGTAGRRAAVEHIELWALSETEWRIRNRDIPLGDPGSILGFAEKTDGRFEVLQLSGTRPGRGATRLSFGSLNDVVAYFDGVR
jgi:hypothetical protein